MKKLLIVGGGITDPLNEVDPHSGRFRSWS
jgi:hypothetical protein